MNNMRLGQTGACIAIYSVTALFGFTAFLYVINPTVALIVLFIIMILFDMFIEYTGMISPKYRPILNVLDKFKAQFEKGYHDFDVPETEEEQLQEEQPEAEPTEENE